MSAPKFCRYCGSNQERFYSVKTIATILDCPEKTIWGWLNEGTLLGVKAGGLRRISARELEKFIKGLPPID